MLKYRILVVDDEAAQREMLAGYLEKNGYKVSTAGSGKEGLELCKDTFVELALVDLKMPEMNGIEFIEELKKTSPDTQAIVMTAYGSMESAIEAMKLGAYDYISKPIDLEELRMNIEKILETQSILAENRFLKEQIDERYKDLKIIGKSKNIKELLSTVVRVAKTDSIVLIRGESGTGKELIARAIHTLSPRSENNFVPVSCAALPETLLESELFGYEKGAFTGADKRKEGRFEIANNGTLFLDEIGDISLQMQVKLLRVIEAQSFERLGGKDTLKVDVRIVTATNQNLEQKIKEGKFREDLYFRLNVISILIPPLRERKEDILPLVEHFIDKINKKCGKAVKGITPSAKDLILKYHWPGNVRELENVIERGLVLCRGDVIDKEDLGWMSFTQTQAPSDSLRDIERDHILNVLKQNDWNIGKTAEVLGIHRNTLRMKIEEYKLKHE
jgi:two-component system, NtrC family, response regulator AtoC